MNREIETVRVVFRVWKADPRSVVALFPDIPFDHRGQFVTCYEHIGQHGSAEYAYVISATRPAKPSEYRALLSELKSIGYDVIVRVRR